MRLRYGYRRVHVLLRREGWEINMKKTRRIYSELGANLRNGHTERRMNAKLREDRTEALGPNDICGRARMSVNREVCGSFSISNDLDA